MGRVFDIFRNLRLVWCLFWDRRVPIFLKMAVPISLGYLAWPWDLLKDFMGIPGVGRLDDLIILALAFIIFVRFAPPQIVSEHREAIWGARLKKNGDITEGEYRILNDEEREETDQSRE